MFGLAFGKAQLIGIAVALIAYIGLFVYAGYQHQRAEAAVAKAGKLDAALQQTLVANKSNSDSINILLDAVKKWESLATSSKGLKEAADKAAKLNAELIKTRIERDRLALQKDKGNVTCAKLLETDFASVCPNVARELRIRAESGYGNKDGTGADPGN
jgi:hypothetical protein